MFALLARHTGCIPLDIGHLGALKYLVLHLNRLTGE